MHNFDEQINRRGTHSLKWDMLEEFYGKDDLLSMWVADSDFKTPPAVIERLVKRAEHGLFGYTGSTDPFYQAFIQWMLKRHGARVEKEWLVTTPGVVAAINFAIQCFTKADDKIIIQTPVYPPFYQAVRNNHRQLVENPLVEKADTYEMDFDHLESIIDSQTKLLILCNPHNPIGRVWTKEELHKLGAICTKHNLLVISDEIHSDLILSGYKHTPFAWLSDDLLARTISCYAPSKTFNVAGLSTSITAIQNPELRQQFLDYKMTIGIKVNTIFGIEAFTACYEEGESWLEDQLNYIEGNIQYAQNYLTKELPILKSFKMEGTYLMWLDCRNLGMDSKALQTFFVDHVKVALNNGAMFGSAGKGFMRVNLATTRHNVIQFMDQLKKACQQL